jgi:hypothetical protein
MSDGTGFDGTGLDGTGLDDAGAIGGRSGVPGAAGGADGPYRGWVLALVCGALPAALLLTLRDGKTFLVTVDDAATGAALLNDLIAGPRQHGEASGP